MKETKIITVYGHDYDGAEWVKAKAEIEALKSEGFKQVSSDEVRGLYTLTFTREVEEPPEKVGHGLFVVCFVLDKHARSDWEAFDCESDAVKRYEELVECGHCYTVTLAKPIRSTDYDCEPASGHCAD